MSKYSTEVIRRVYDDGEGVYLEIGTCQDGTPGVVSLTSGGEPKSREWFGSFYLSLSPDHARQVAAALLARTEEAEKEVKE